MTSRREWRTVARVISELGATMLVAQPPYEPLTRARMVAARWRVDNEHTPHTLAWWPLHAASCAVVTDAPYGPEEGNWRGRAARLLRHALQAAAIPLDTIAHISMWPQRFAADGRGKPGYSDGAYRAPLDSELRAATARVDAAIAAANTRYVIWVGSGAQRYWRPDLRLATVSGHVGVYDRYVCMAVEHPNAILREATDAPVWRWKFARFGQIIEDDIGPVAIENICLCCRNEPVAYDPYGIGYCELHLDNGFNTGYNLRFGRKSRPQQTERLFP